MLVSWQLSGATDSRLMLLWTSFAIDDLGTMKLMNHPSHNPLCIRSSFYFCNLTLSMQRLCSTWTALNLVGFG